MLPEQKSQIEMLQGGPIRVHLVFQAVLRLQLIGVDPQAKPPGLSRVAHCIRNCLLLS
jgi:hypothetical protein